MTIETLRKLVQVDAQRDVDMDTIKSWCELGRQRVVGAGGRWSWLSLLKYTTISVVRGTTDYTSPFQPTDPGIRKILAIEQQGQQYAPMNMYTPEAFAATQFDDALQGMTIIDIPQPGQMTIRFSLAPNASQSLDCWFQRKLDVDDLSFVAEEDHGIFYWAALTYAYPKIESQVPGVSTAISIAEKMFQSHLDSAIMNDYITASEIRLLAPPALMQQLQNNMISMRGRR